MTLEIDHLFHRPDRRYLVASWIFEAFWRERPESGISVATLKGHLEEASNPDAIPLSLLAQVDDEPAGTVNLVENDDSERQHLRPWLAALFVAPAFRGRDIGISLVCALSDHAARLGLTEIYLGTHIPDFYRRVGAAVIEVDAGHFVMRLPVPIVDGSG